jgi:Mg-chelatase subunit ChlD
MNKKTATSLTTLVLVCLLSNTASAQADKKTAYAVLLDNTGSMRTQFPQVVLLGKLVISQFHERGPISIFNFQTHVSGAVINAGVEFTQDEAKLNTYIDSLSVVGGKTALIKAIESAAEGLALKAGNAGAEEKVLILITDGEDRIVGGMASGPQALDDDMRSAQNSLLKKLKKMGVKVFAIGLTRELSSEGGLIRLSDRDRAEFFLAKIAKQTGGRAVFSRSTKFNADSLVVELLGK